MRRYSPTHSVHSAVALLCGTMLSCFYFLCAVAVASCTILPPFTGWPYSCVWNSPTEECQHFGDIFSLWQYLIVQNKGDTFYGGNMTIFYGIGHFPHIDRSTGQYIYGGIPQLGNITDHIIQVKADIESLIPDPSYSGLAVIDFEQWRPLFVHNFDSLAIYQKASEELVAKEHPTWNKTQVEQEAEVQFDAAARLFFLDTLTAAKALRPNAYWGYYGFPRCYGNPGNYCSPDSQSDNDRLWWLWQGSTALYPRIYLSVDPNITHHILYLMSTVHEAVRVARNQSSPLPPPVVYPYSRHTYDGSPGMFYSPEDVWLSHAISSLLGATGVVIWGSSSSTDTHTLCDQLYNYTSVFFGPCIRNFTAWSRECGQSVCGGHGQCITGDIPPVGGIAWKDGGSDEMEEVWEWVKRWVGDPRESDCHGAGTGNYMCQCYQGWSGEHCENSSGTMKK